MTLTLSDTLFELKQDDYTFIGKWENFSKVVISDKYITITDAKDIGYIFPANSMKSEEFLKLTQFVKSSMNTSKIESADKSTPL